MVGPFDVCGIGNAIVDVVAECENEFLEEHSIPKSGMLLIDEARADFLCSKIKPEKEMSGGSAGNTIVGIASFGGKPAYIGKVRNDRLGGVFTKDMRDAGVYFDAPPATSGPSTARCISLVTPDAQRSMCTFLGASETFSPEDIQPEVIQASQLTYLEGYLFDRPSAQEAFIKAAQIAHAAGRKLALSLSDTFCVDRHRSEFLSLVKDNIDILLSNEYELKALYQTNTLEAAVAAARSNCELIVATKGAAGALIAVKDQTIHKDAAPTEKLVDTTGAGDLFAAGFLFGYTHGYDLADCGRLANSAAAEIISHFGGRPKTPLKDLV
ncbi:MAG: adenosine kinase [Alphaproteobacteria bacterium]|nr:adenosine kinase [Alphaproteobacteria bacterium]